MAVSRLNPFFQSNNKPYSVLSYPSCILENCYGVQIPLPVLFYIKLLIFVAFWLIDLLICEDYFEFVCHEKENSK